MESPPAFPNSISVFNLSPTIIVRFGSKWCLDHAAGCQKGTGSEVRRRKAPLRHDTVKHRLAGFPDGQRRPLWSQSVLERSDARPGARKESMASRIRGVLVCSNERAVWVGMKVAKRLAHLRVVDGHVEADDHGANREIWQDLGGRFEGVVRRILPCFKVTGVNLSVRRMRRSRMD